MGDRSKIEWTDDTWNPTTGCTKVSPGCDNCYAERQTERFHGLGSFTEITLRPDRLHVPLRWKKPRRVFVDSMSDLFHGDIPDEYIAQVFAVMALTRRHTYQVLTERHARMRSLLASDEFRSLVAEYATAKIGARAWQYWQLDLGGHRLAGDSGLGAGWTVTEIADGSLWSPPWPLPNIWLGVSVEYQKWAEIRVPALLAAPAAVRFLSCEPLLGPVRLGDWLLSTLPGYERVGIEPLHNVPSVDWVIVGGESGPKARPMHPDWARSLRDECQAAGVPFFFKQHGEWAPVGPLYGDDDDDQQADYEEADDARMAAVDLEVSEGMRVVQLETNGYVAEGHQPGDPRTWLMARVGKRAAGRELDGRTWDQYPEASNA